MRTSSTNKKQRASLPENRTLARKVSLYFLTLILGGLLTVGIYNLYRHFSPQYLVVDPIPFGLPPGTQIPMQEKDAGEEALQKLPPTTQQELKRAMELWKAGSYQTAGPVFAAVAIQFPRLAVAYLGQGLSILAHDSLHDQMLADVNTVISILERIHPESAELLTLRGRLAQVNQQETIALNLLEQAVEKKPTLLESRFILGELQAQNHLTHAAINQARTGISLSLGNDPRFYRLLAGIWHNQGTMDSCNQVVEYATTRFPNDQDLLILRGYLQEYRGHFDQAEQTYRKVMALNPDNQKAHLALQTLGEKSPPGLNRSEGMITPKDQAQIAIGILEPLVQQYPQNMPLRDALGQAYLKGRLFDLAKIQFEAIEEQDPEYPEIHQRIQEASATIQNPITEMELTEELHRNMKELRDRTAKERAFSEKLGHYLIRWGASPEDFFRKYPQKQFKKISSGVWQEEFTEPPLHHRYTVVFRPEHGLSAVYVHLQDTSKIAGRSNVMYNLFGQLLGQNNRISGIGMQIGDTECEEGTFQGAVWETPDNFEMMIQMRDIRNQVRMLRLDRKQYETMPRICALLKEVHKF